MFYVYILKSKKSGKFYKGFTSNLRARLKKHNSGGSEFTKGKGPWSLVYYEAFMNENDARREEFFLKTEKGRERIKYLLESI